MDEEARLSARLEELSRLLSEQEARMPAHSVRVNQMEELLRLEEELDSVREELGRLRGIKE